MRKRGKQVFAVFLAAVLLFGFVPSSGFHWFSDWLTMHVNAVNSGQCGENVWWYYASDTLYIYGSGAMYNYTSNVDVPWRTTSIKTISIGNGVTEIGDYAFYGVSSGSNDNIEVSISGSVTRIGAHAFENCKRLSNITIPDSVTEIGDYAFSGCFEALSSISNQITYYTVYGLSDVTIGSGVTRIGEHTFDGCCNLSSVVIPDNVTEIGDYAFNGCATRLNSGGKMVFYGLSSVTFGSSVSRIGAHAFEGCWHLSEELSIPDSVTEIGDYAFIRCDGRGYSSSGAGGLKSITIGSGVTRIGAYAFAECSTISSVVFLNSKTEIGEYAFYYCYDLSVTFGNGVTRIGAHAFEGCTMTSLTIPDSVTEIDDFAFYKTVYFSNSSNYWTKYPISIGSGVKRIGYCAFCGCSNLAKTTIPDGVTEIGSLAFQNVGSIVYSGNASGAPWGATHHYALEQTVDAPTCTQAGNGKYTCTICGDSYVENAVPALGHLFGEWETVAAPTIESEGQERRVCTRCGVTEERNLPVLSADAIVISASNAVVGCSAGRLVRVAVNLTNNTGIISARMHIGYDAQQLRLLQVENGTVFDQEDYLPGGDLNAVPYTVLWSDDLATNDNTTNGTLITLTFSVLNTATAGDTAISLSCDAGSTFNSDLQLVSFYTYDGRVSIVKCLPGDTNEDGTVNLQDTVLLSRHLAGGWNVTINEVNADVNGDGFVDLKDVVLIRRFLAGGWEITLI